MKTSSLLSVVLWAIAAQSLAGWLEKALPTLESRGVEDASTSVSGPKPRIEFVWRGEMESRPRSDQLRNPKTLRKIGGFYSRGVEKILKGERILPSQAERGSSLYMHSVGSTNLPWTRYVSTSTDPLQSLRFAVHGKPSNAAFLYKIRADAKMIDIPEALRDEFQYPEQAEQAVVGYIPWDQVMGWYDLSDPKVVRGLIEHSAKLESGQDLPGYQPNPKFNAKKYPASAGTSGPQPQLAGFPLASNIKAWDDKFWQEHKGVSVAKNLEDFMYAKGIADRQSSGGPWEWTMTPSIKKYLDATSSKKKDEQPRPSMSKELMYRMLVMEEAVEKSFQMLYMIQTNMPEHQTSSKWGDLEASLADRELDLRFVMQQVSNALDSNGHEALELWEANMVVAEAKYMLDVLGDVKSTLVKVQLASALRQADEALHHQQDPPAYDEEASNSNSDAAARLQRAAVLLETQMAKLQAATRRQAQINTLLQAMNVIPGSDDDDVDDDDLSSESETLSSADASLVEKLNKLDLPHLPPSSEPIQAAIAREVGIVGREIKLRARSQADLKVKLDETRRALAQLQQEAAAAESAQQKEKAIEAAAATTDKMNHDNDTPSRLASPTRPPTTANPNPPKEKDETRPKETKDKTPPKKPKDKTPRQKVAAVKKSALRAVRKASKDAALSPLLRDSLKGAGLLLASFGLASIAHVMATGGAQVSVAAAVSEAGSSSAAGLVEAVAGTDFDGEVVAAAEEASSAMTSLSVTQTVTEAQVIEALESIDAKIANDFVAKTAPKATRQALRKMKMKMGVAVRRRQDGLDPDMVRTWAGLAMGDILVWELEVVFKQLVAELEREIGAG